MRTEEGADPSGAWTGLVGVIGAVLILAIIVGLQAFFNETQKAELDRKVYSAVYEDLVRIRSEQMENLNSYEWVDREVGTVAIPIDRAKELIIEESRSRTQGRGATSSDASAAPAPGTEG